MTSGAHAGITSTIKALQLQVELYFNHSSSSSHSPSISYTESFLQIQVIKMYQNTLSLVLQLTLASMAAAAPVKAQSNTWQYGTGGGIVGLIVFILDLIVICEYLCPSILLAGVSNETS
jgi:hypothetical protein